jgi:hypothetical protein
VGAASCREGRKGEGRVSRGGAVNAAKGKRTEIRSQEVVGAASCREGRKGEEQVSRGDAANATEGENQGECVALSRKITGFLVAPAPP